MKSLKTNNHIPYATESNDIFDSIENILNDKNKSRDVIVPNISNIDLSIVTSFYKQASLKYPIIEQTVSANKNILGNSSIIEVKKKHNNTLYFCQMFCDRKSRIKNIHYAHLVNCMIDLRKFCILKNKKEYTTIEIHAPKFGTGISGGRWSTISDLISDCWYGIPTFIYRN